MGSGKSAVGRQVAARLRFQFVDTDDLIAERSGLAIPEIFARHGEPHFRELETSALESCGMFSRYVIATGGGVILRPENHALLRSLGFIVQLTASEDVIFERVSRNANRPLLQTPDPRGTVARMLEERRPLYDQVADFTVDNSSMPHADCTQEIVSAVRKAFGWE